MNLIGRPIAEYKKSIYELHSNIEYQERRYEAHLSPCPPLYTFSLLLLSLSPVSHTVETPAARLFPSHHQIRHYFFSCYKI